MQPTPSLGEFEQLILLAILRLGPDAAYGLPIGQEIAACTPRRPTPGALYTTLDRLESKQLVQSRFAQATAERGGRAKRLFTLTPAGRTALVEAQRGFQRMLSGLDLLPENS